MPSFIKDKKDENKWKKAKQAASESKKKDQASFVDQDWALVNHIYQKMQKSNKFNMSRLDTVSFLLEALKKAKQKMSDDYSPEDDQEDNNGNDETPTSNDQDYLMNQAWGKDEPSEDQDVDSDNYEEYGDNEDEDKQRRSIMDDAGYENISDDSPANDAQDEEEDRQRRTVLNDDDYSDIENAKYHDPSREQLAELRSFTQPQQRYNDEYSALDADGKKNPILASRGDVIEARNNAFKERVDKLKQMQSSPEWKNATSAQRRKMDAEFQAKFEAENPNHAVDAMKAHDAASKKAVEHNKAYQAAQDAKMQNIIRGGGQSPDAVSLEEGIQHAGGQRDEDGGATGLNIMQDPATAFAQRNKELVRQMGQKARDPSFGQNMDDVDNPGTPKRDINKILGSKMDKNPKFEKFFEHYYPLIMKTIKRTVNDPAYRGLNLDHEDYHEAGMHGLIQAINTFDHDRPKKPTFATFAAKKIEGLVRSAIKSQDEIPVEARKAEKEFSQGPTGQPRVRSSTKRFINNESFGKPKEKAKNVDPALIEEWKQRQAQKPKVAPPPPPEAPEQGSTEKLLQTSNHPRAPEMADRLKRVSAIRRPAGTKPAPQQPITQIDPDIAEGSPYEQSNADIDIPNEGIKGTR